MNYDSFKLDDNPTQGMGTAFSRGFLYKISLTLDAHDSNYYTTGTTRNRTYQLRAFREAMITRFGEGDHSGIAPHVFWCKNPFLTNIIYIKDLEKFDEFFVEHKLTG